MDSREKKYENEFSEFLIRRIKTGGGSLKVQHITGHLSQVRSEVRNAVVSSQTDLIRFLLKHDNLFVIENDVVKLKSSALSTSGYESDASSTKSYSNLPPKIKNGKGVIVKIFSNYGFIKSKEPIKTEIFFNSECFGDREIDLTSFLYIGAIVFFNARLDSYSKRESSKSSCKYRALKVWRVDSGDDEGSVIVQKSRKNRETGLYDPLNLESEGVIQNIFPNLGFISVKGDDNNTVFFHKNRVINYDNIVDLTKVLSKGDKVEFTAHRSSKPDAKARWEATKVWKISGKIKENTSQSENNQLSLPKQSIPFSRTKVPEMIKNQRGKIYPRSHGAVIKFGNNELADGDAAVYYICGSQVTDVGWEFTEGDDVYFDAVKIKSAPGWKAVLVWTDTKPDIVLPTCLGDFSGFTEEDDNASVNSYTSKSSLCMSENSSPSLKSEKLSKTKDSKTEKSRKLSKNHNASSRDSLNSLSFSDKHSLASKEAESINKLSRNYSRDSLNSLPLSDKCNYTSKKVKSTNKKLSRNYNASSRDNLSSLTTSDKCHHLKSSESTVKSSSNKFVDHSNKMLSNWGESSYPADEAYESMEISKSFKSNISLKSDSEVKQFNRDEMESSSEYGSDDEEVNKNSEIKKCKTQSQNNSVKDFETESSKTSSRNDNLYAASVKRYNGIKGEIDKVYSRFAEVKSSFSQHIVSFSLNDFYLNGKSMDELDLDDLKDILKTRDIISFNSFLIIDDCGDNWQKITLAWKGSKPKHVKEISPEDFILQNDLSVTVNSKANDDEITDKDIQRKFLTSFVDDIPDDTTDNNLSRTESCSEEESLPSIPKSPARSEIELPVNSESLSDIVCRLLKKDIFSDDSMIDIKSVSEEIINAVLQNYSAKDITLTYNVLPEAKCTSEPFENVCSKCKERSLSLNNSPVKIKSTATQTIITGDIISHNILADC